MFTKMMSAVVLTGALWVVGDAGVKSVGCCFPGSDCCSPPRECCFFDSSSTAKSSDCCALDLDCCQPASNCCSAVKSSKAAKQSCCSTGATAKAASTYFYCTLTGEIYSECCEVVNGELRCVVTGLPVDECCIPLD